MSHFTRVKTRLHCIDSLKEALEAMGLAWKEGPCYARGFGSQRTHAELVVDTKTGLDVGFVSGEQGLEVVADWELIEQRCAMPPVGPVILSDTTLHVSCSVATIDMYMLRKIQQST